MKRLLVTTLFVTIISFSAINCKTLTFSASKTSDPQNVGLDSMDMSILFPPPLFLDSVDGKQALKQIQKKQDEYLSKISTLSEFGYWPNLIDKQGGFLDDATFDRVLSPTLGTYSDLYDKGLMRWDLNFRGPNNEMNLLDMSEKRRWKVVSYRFSPCPFEVHQSKNRDRTDKCTPELRIVAQPVIGFTAAEALLAPTLPVGVNAANNAQAVPSKDFNPGFTFGDFSIHLFFRLKDMDESKQVAKEIFDLKMKMRSECPTTGELLGPHICLVTQAPMVLERKIPPDQTFALQMMSIFKRHTHSLHRVAVWGSTQNAGPWGFYFGELDKGRFEWKNIPTLVPNSFSESSKKTGFNDGKAMLYTRGSSVSGGNQRVISETHTLRPDPRPSLDNLQMFLANQLRFSETGLLQSARAPRVDSPVWVEKLYREFLTTQEKEQRVGAKSGRYISDLASVLENIDNPDKNSDQTVDCISCHLSKSEGVFLRREVSDAKKREGAFKQATSDSDRLIEEWYYWQVQNGFKTPPGLTSSTHKLFQSHPLKRFGEVYVLNQFSIYFSHPMVSTRVANESAKDADFANRVLIRKPNPVETSCNQEALKACLLSVPDKELTQEVRNSFNFFPYKASDRPQEKLCKQNFCGSAFDNWNAESELQRVTQFQKDLVIHIADQLGFLALRDEPLPGRNGLQKETKDRFANAAFENPIQIEVPEYFDLKESTWERVWTNRPAVDASRGGKHSVSLKLSSSNNTYLGPGPVPALSFTHKAKVQGFNAPIEAKIYSLRNLNVLQNPGNTTVWELQSASERFQSFQDEGGKAWLERSPLTQYAPFVKSSEIQLFQKTVLENLDKQTLKLTYLNKYALLLESSSGMREIYLNYFVYPNDTYPQFPRPAGLTELQVFEAIEARANLTQ